MAKQHHKDLSGPGRIRADQYHVAFLGVEYPFSQPMGSEFAERVEAAGRDKHIWKPISPALSKRINAAVGRWKASRGKAFYEELDGGSEACVNHFDDKDIVGLLSTAISVKEDYFASILEQLPPTGDLTVIPRFKLPTDDPAFIPPEEHIPEDDKEYIVTEVVTYAVKGLQHTASCRRSIGSGRTVLAAWEMNAVNEYYWLIRTTLRDDATVPFVEMVRNYQEGHKRSGTTKRKSKLEEHRDWLAMDLELSLEHPDWSPTARAEEIGERVKRSSSRVLAVLKGLREEENGPTANS